MTEYLDNRTLPTVAELDIQSQIMDLFANKIALIRIGTKEYLSMDASIQKEEGVYFTIACLTPGVISNRICIPYINLSKARTVDHHLYVESKDGRQMDITFLSANTLSLESMSKNSPKALQQANNRSDLIYRIRDCAMGNKSLHLNRIDCRELYRALEGSWVTDHIQSLDSSNASIAHQLLMSLRINAEHNDGWRLADFEKESLYRLLIQPVFSL